MLITLRKANAIQTQINDTIKNISMKYQIEINEFQDPAFEIHQANTELMTNDHRRQRLLLALYTIRGLVGTANVQSGIDLLLSKSAYLDKRISQLQEMAGLQPVTNLEVLNGKLEKIKSSSPESRLYRNDTVSTGLLSLTQIDVVKKEIRDLKKQKQKINDEILELNIKTEIPLSQEVVNTLTSEDLV